MRDTQSIQDIIVHEQIRPRLAQAHGRARWALKEPHVRECIDAAARWVAPVWPLTSFVSRNPLMGFEHLPFASAQPEVRRWFYATMFASLETRRQAFHRGDIGLRELRDQWAQLLADVPVVPHIPSVPPFTESDERRDHVERTASAPHATLRSNSPLAKYLWKRIVDDAERALPARVQQRLTHIAQRRASELLAAGHEHPSARGLHEVLEPEPLLRVRLADDALGTRCFVTLQQQVAQWCAVYFDQAVAAVPMPGRQGGLFAAFKGLVAHDGAFSEDARAWLRGLPLDPHEAVRDALRTLEVPPEVWSDYLREHCVAMPGWAGYVKRDSEETKDEQNTGQDSPRSAREPMAEYLALRLSLEVMILRDCLHHGPHRSMELIEHPIACLHRLARSVRAARKHRELTQRLQSAWAALVRHDEAHVDVLSGVSAAALVDLVRLESWLVESYVPRVWLQAWEQTERAELIRTLQSPSVTVEQPRSLRPNAQLVFCIDVRSEAFRRALEWEGNYETYGFAGFFGIPLEVREFGHHHSVASCPVIVQPAHRVAQVPADAHKQRAVRHLSNRNALQSVQHWVHGAQHGVTTTFAVAETLGLVHGLSMLLRSLDAAAWKRWALRVYRWLVPDIATKPCLESSPSGHGSDGVHVDDRIRYASQALRTLGLTHKFAPVVVWVGHGSDTTNNPFASKLDCGACGGRAGGFNAQVLAEICNDAAVRRALRDHGIEIPSDTVFLAAEHITTRDELEWQGEAHAALTPAQQVALQRLERDVARARQRVVVERAAALGHASHASHAGQARQANDEAASSLAGLNGAIAEPREHELAAAERDVQRRSHDWSEVRPEWGLARNASMIIGPRAWTRGKDLRSRAFLQSYEWELDQDGALLDTILGGPLAVAYWINTQYYFSTVAHAAFGSGNKTVQSVVSNLGVILGNGSDLQTGLPLQSVCDDSGSAYHAPIRLWAVIHAPADHVHRALQRNPRLTELLDHEWLALSVYDPREQAWWRYHRDGWQRLRTAGSPSGVWQRQSA